MLKEFDYSSNILIASIDPEISNVLGVLLNNLSYKVELVNSGNEALEQINRNNFDLLLLDAVLPDMNVKQILNYIENTSSGTLVIVMTGEVASDKPGEYLRTGAYDYLKKPFSREEIQRRIENALEQKRLEKEIEDINNLTEVSKKRNSFIQNTEDIIYTLDYEGRFTSVNDSLREKLGYRNNSLLRQHYSVIIYPEDIKKAVHIFNERRAEERGLNMIRLRLKKHSDNTGSNDNRYITVEIKARGIYNQNTEREEKLFLGTYGVARDVSAFLEKEETLKTQKTYFRELFNNSKDAAVILDRNCRVLNANKTFENIFKYTHTEIKNNSIHDLILPENLSHEAESLTSSIREMEFIELETVRRTKDGRNINVMIYGHPIIFNEKHIGSYQIYRDLAALKRNEKKLKESLHKVRESMGNITNAMVSTVEVRDPYTIGHQQRVANLARAIASEIGLPKDEIDAIRLAGTLHDLGKVNIPAEILSKPGQLSSIELNLIKMHPTIAYNILKKIDFPWDIAEIVYQHHERLDGSGYPRGIKGNDIEMASRILSVADVVESIASHRPYRPALGVRKALEEITGKKKTSFDPKVVDACVSLFYERNFSFEGGYPCNIESKVFQVPA